MLHVPPDSPSLLADILGRKGRLRAQTAEAHETFEPGTIYVAKPDYLIVRRNGAGLTMNVARGPRENRHRPAIDPLFRSAALAAGENAIGVVLSGTLDDGTAGLIAIKQCGGIAVVQDPEDAMYPSMPQSAIDNVTVDHVVPSRRWLRSSRAWSAPSVPRRKKTRYERHSTGDQHGGAEARRTAHRRTSRPAVPLLLPRMRRRVVGDR